MGGGYPGYYYHYMAWDVIHPEDEPPGYELHRRLVEFMREGAWWEMEPQMGIAAANNEGEARCLASTGKEYVLFARAGKAARVTLPGLADGSAVTCDWLQPLTGERGTSTAEVGPRVALKPLFAGPYVVRIRPVIAGA